VRRHRFNGTQAQFEKSHAYRQHDHLICTECGEVQEFCDPRIQQIRNTASEVMGFEVRYHTYRSTAPVNLPSQTPTIMTVTDRPMFDLAVSEEKELQGLPSQRPTDGPAAGRPSDGHLG
jgi:hypothetical protein